MGVKENVVHIVKYLIFLPGVLSDMFFFNYFLDNFASSPP